MGKIKHAKDPLGPHMRIYWGVVDCAAWSLLTNADVRVYMAMRRQLTSWNNGDIHASLARMKERGVASSSTLAAALKRLQQLGFIAMTRKGGIASGGKTCCLYRFTDLPTLEIPKLGIVARPATNEWRRLKTTGEARAALKVPPEK